MPEESVCNICMEPLEMIGLGRCNHKLTCALCHFKMRTKQDKMECTVCKALNEHIIITDDFEACFNSFDLDDCLEYSEGNLYFPTEEHKQQFELLICNKCPFPECDGARLHLHTPQEYKRHLKERHNKYLW